MSLFLVNFKQLRSNPLFQKVIEFSRPANTTAYAAGDVVAPATGAITAASNASRIVVTSTAHGLLTGDRATIASVGGNTNANGDFQIEKIDANTFYIKNESGAYIAGNAAYTSGGTFQKMLRLADVADEKGGTVELVSVRLITNIATVTNGIFRLRLYNAPISQIADNAAWTLLWANRAKRMIDLLLTILVTEGSGSDASEVSYVATLPVPLVCDASRTDVFVQVLATAAFTPGSGEVFRLEFFFRKTQLRPLT